MKKLKNVEVLKIVVIGSNVLSGNLNLRIGVISSKCKRFESDVFLLDFNKNSVCL